MAKTTKKEAEVLDFKIVTETTPQVLVYRDRNDEGDTYVCVKAWGGEDGDYFMEEVIDCPNIKIAQDYIADYSVASANRFIDRNKE